MIEQIKGKYLLDRRLGCGGMAEVYAGRTTGAGGFARHVAIKRILSSYSDDPQFRAMFAAEGQLSARLVHGNIVAVHDFDEDEGGRLFMVMELVDGVDLAGLSRTGRVPLSIVLHVTREILCGLQHAHELPVSADGVRGLVHRDVSPQNVLVSWAGEVKVSDFGIAKARGATQASASIFIKGKPAYMSPEQANGDRLDGRSDLFAVGVMLWELLCGEPLFVREPVAATLKSLLFDPIPTPRSKRPDIPEDVERVTMRLLERDREARYPSAEAASAALAGCAAFPRNGRELLSALLVERLPPRIQDRCEGITTRLEPRTPAMTVANGDPARTQVAEAAALPHPAQVDRCDTGAAWIPRPRRAVPLALLGVATALAAGLAIGVPAHLGGHGDSGPPASGAAPSLVEPPPRPPERQAVTEPRTASTAAPREAPVPPALVAPVAREEPAPAPAAQHTTKHATKSTAGPRAASPGLPDHVEPRERKPPSAPARDATPAGGIREIDLAESGSAWN